VRLYGNIPMAEGYRGWCRARSDAGRYTYRDQDAKLSSQYWELATFSGKAVWQHNPSA